MSISAGFTVYVLLIEVFTVKRLVFLDGRTSKLVSNVILAQYIRTLIRDKMAAGFKCSG